MKNNNPIKTTSLDYAILGLVHQQPMSGYGIRKEFELTAIGNYSSSPGAIYPALKRLGKFELVQNRPDKEDGKNKFYCTNLGKEVLIEWVSQPLTLKDVAQIMDELLLRFSFMDALVGKEKALLFLTSFRDLSKAYLKEIQEYHHNQYDSLPLHGRLALEYGIETYKTTYKWCKNAITVITKNTSL